MDCGKPVHKDVMPKRSKHVPPPDPDVKELGIPIVSGSTGPSLFADEEEAPAPRALPPHLSHKGGRMNA
jgi:hypothetical protein